jgi:hypothetical protein
MKIRAATWPSLQFELTMINANCRISTVSEISISPRRAQTSPKRTIKPFPVKGASAKYVDVAIFPGEDGHRRHHRTALWESASAFPHRNRRKGKVLVGNRQGRLLPPLEARAMTVRSQEKSLLSRTL